MICQMLGQGHVLKSVRSIAIWVSSEVCLQAGGEKNPQWPPLRLANMELKPIAPHGCKPKGVMEGALLQALWQSSVLGSWLWTPSSVKIVVDPVQWPKVPCGPKPKPQRSKGQRPVLTLQEPLDYGQTEWANILNIYYIYMYNVSESSQCALRTRFDEIDGWLGFKTLDTAQPNRSRRTGPVSR